MPTPLARSPRSSIVGALAGYLSIWIRILFLKLIAKILRLCERFLISLILMVSDTGSNRGRDGCGGRGRGRMPESSGHKWVTIARSGEIMDILDGRLLKVSNVERCSDIVEDEKEGHKDTYAELEVDEVFLDAANQTGEGELEDDAEAEKQLESLAHPTRVEKHVSRWGAIPSADELRGKMEMDHTNSSLGEMDASLSDTFDDPAGEYGGRKLFRPFVSNGDLPRTVTAAQSGDSIASDDPFLPPGLVSPGSLTLSLTPRRTVSTFIQPGSAAASSSRSRMSFANRDKDAELKTSPTVSMKARPRMSRFGSEIRGEDSEESMVHTMKTSTAADLNFSELPTRTSVNIIGDPTEIITKTRANTPTQISHALSALSFWTPAPKVAVTLAPPVKRRRGGRRRDKEGNNEKKSESANHDVFGERKMLQPGGEN